MKVADRARYLDLREERKDLQKRIDAIEAAISHVNRITDAACGEYDCDCCPMRNICNLTDKAYVKLRELRQRLTDVHNELSEIFSRKEGK